MGREASKTKVNEKHVKELDGRVSECFAQKFVWGVWILLQLQRPWRERHTEQNSFASWIQFVCNQNEWLWKDQFTCNISHLDHWYIICSCPPIPLTFLHSNGEKTQSYIRLSWNQADTSSSNANQAFKSVEIKASLPGGEMYHHQQPRSWFLGFLHNKKERNARFLQG